MSDCPGLDVCLDSVSECTMYMASVWRGTLTVGHSECTLYVASADSLPCPRRPLSWQATVACTAQISPWDILTSTTLAASLHHTLHSFIKASLHNMPQSSWHLSTILHTHHGISSTYSTLLSHLATILDTHPGISPPTPHSISL